MKNAKNKYIYLNGIDLLLGVLSAIFFSSIVFDSSKYYPVALLMVPAFLFYFIASKMYYKEDDKSNNKFILRLLAPRGNIMLGKNIAGQLCIVLGIIAVYVMLKIANVIFSRADIMPDINVVLVIACTLIAYNAIYIYLYYKLGEFKSQILSYIMFGLMITLFKFGNEFIELVSDINLYVLVIVGVILEIVSVLFTKPKG